MRLAHGLIGFILLALTPFADARAVQFDADVPQALRKQVNEDLAFLGALNGNGATRLHREIFGEVRGSVYTRWFGRRVSQVGMSLCGGDGAVACVLSAWGNKLWFSPNYTNFDHPQIARLMVLLHEARHTEAREGFWAHAKCPRPFLDESGQEIRSIWTGGSLAGEPACDESARGSYGVATVFLKNISKHCADCTEKTRMDAEIYGEDQLDRITNSVYRREMLEDFE